MLVALGGAAIGFIAPDFFINSRTRGRRERCRWSCPNVLDLLCVSVEAGLGFDAALAKLTERMTGPLVEEFGLVLHEMRIGESRSEALKNLSERVDVPRCRSSAAPIIQADQLGIALVAHPARAVPRHARPAPAGGRGEGDEGAGQDALPDRALHLPRRCSWSRSARPR